MKLKKILYYLIVLGFIGGCVIGFRTDIAKISLTALLPSLDKIVLALLLSLFNYGLRAARWTLYLGKLGHKVKPKFSVLSYFAGFAFTISPGKVGELVRGRYLLEAKVPISSTAAAFFVERLMDLLAMMALASLAAIDSGYQGLIWGAISFTVSIMLTLSFAPWLRIITWAERIDFLPEAIKKALLSIFRTLIFCRVLLRPGILTFGFALGILAWGAEGLGLMVISEITPSATLDLTQAMGIYSIAVIIGALSFLPGGLGGTEAAMGTLLTAEGFATPDAILLTMLCRLFTLWFAVLLGWIAVLLLRKKPIKPISFPLPQDNVEIPLCVDLDGTLIHSDCLYESLLLLLKRHPGYVFLLPIWLGKGKAELKAEISKRVELPVSYLPYNQPFLLWLQNQHALGRPIWLCTASNYRIADAIAQHLKIFSGVLASNDQVNLSGAKKAERLTQQFGAKGFDYCGNSKVDLAIWRVSRQAIAVNCSQKLLNSASKIIEVAGVFPRPWSFFKPMLKAMRLHQWAKNVLVFVPLATAHKLSEFHSIQQAIIAFIAFSVCASSVYLLNDMLDLFADRQHERKRKRPFASGKLSLITGFIATPLLLLITILLSSQLQPTFWWALGIYYLLTITYSFGLKKVLLVDTIMLAALYTIRIVSGATAIDVPLSFWLLLFSVFLFFSLALVKRYAELDALQRKGLLQAAGRGYHIEDLPVVLSMGTASGFMCILVLALYINSAAVASMYQNPQYIWALCMLMLYWISRMWLKTHRGQMHDDPVVFALKDQASLVIGLLAIVAIYAAL